MICITAIVALSAGVVVDHAVVPALAPARNPDAAMVSSYAPDAWKIYAGGMYDKQSGSYAGISFSYPRDFDLREGENASGGFLKTPMVQVRFPQDAYQEPKSNFGEAYMTVSSDNDPKAFSSCFDFAGFGRQAGPSVMRMINGIAFRFATTTDVGAGNIYDSQVFRAQYKQRCYEFALTVHTGNIGNYPERTVIEFDKVPAFAMLDRILETVKFTDAAR